MRLLNLGWILFFGLATIFGAVSPVNSTWAPDVVEPAQSIGELRFAVTADMRYFTADENHFPGVLAALMKLEPTAFMITPGDMDPPATLRAVLNDRMGSDYAWYPVIGNHELPGAGVESSFGDNLAWLRAWPAASGYALERTGPAPCPETTYSFDIPPVHFVALNEYCRTDGDSAGDGDISDLLYDWLTADLAQADQPYTFVIGHEPAFPQPDVDLGGAARHLGDSLDKYPQHRDRFWALLAQHEVTAYLTGHTHSFSAIQKDGVWQIDAGHARGSGDLTFPSTFLVISITPKAALLQVYRGLPDYPLAHTVVLEGAEIYLPVINR